MWVIALPFSYEYLPTQQKCSLKNMSFSAAPMNLVISWGDFSVFRLWFNLENNKTGVRLSESGLRCFNSVKCRHIRTFDGKLKNYFLNAILTEKKPQVKPHWWKLRNFHFGRVREPSGVWLMWVLYKHMTHRNIKHYCLPVFSFDIDLDFEQLLNLIFSIATSFSVSQWVVAPVTMYIYTALQ